MDRALKQKVNELSDTILKMNSEYSRIINENNQMKEDIRLLHENNNKTIQAEIKVMSDIFLYCHSVAIDKMKEKVKLLEERINQLEQK